MGGFDQGRNRLPKVSVRKIQTIEPHQGCIRVESLVGKGSTFTVKLPLTADEAKE